MQFLFYTSWRGRGKWVSVTYFHHQSMIGNLPRVWPWTAWSQDVEAMLPWPYCRGIEAIYDEPKKRRKFLQDFRLTPSRWICKSLIITYWWSLRFTIGWDITPLVISCKRFCWSRSMNGELYVKLGGQNINGERMEASMVRVIEDHWTLTTAGVLSSSHLIVRSPLVSPLFHFQNILICVVSDIVVSARR